MNWIKRANHDLRRDYSGPLNENQERSVNELILTTGRPPVWAEQWATKQLESGNYKNQEEWEDKISKMMMISKGPPIWAEKWAKNKLKSDNFPKEWIEVIEDTMQNKYSDFEVMSTPFEGLWCEYWIGRKLNSGNFPEKWKNWIEDRFKAVGFPPWWAYFYAKRVFLQGNAPPLWIQGIKQHIRKHVTHGGFMWDDPNMHKAIYKYYPELKKADDLFLGYMLRSRLREVQVEFAKARYRAQG